MYCLLLTAFWPVTTIIFRTSGSVKLVKLYFGEQRDWGRGVSKITLIVSCLEWLTCLFLFSMVELMKRYYAAPTLPKGYNVQLSNCLTLTWDATPRDGKRHAGWPKWAATSSPRKIGRPVKIAFWRFLFTIFSLHVALIPGCMSMFKVGKGSPGVLNSLQQKIQFEIL